MSPPSICAPDLPPGVKDFVGRVIHRGTAAVEGLMRQRGMSVGMAEDIALESAFITYRAIVKGSLVLLFDAEGYDLKLTAYMRTVAWRIRRNHRRSGDIMLRHDREPGTEVIVSRTYSIEPLLELASEIAAEPPKARRVLLAMLETGYGPSAAAVSVGMKPDAGKWATRAARKRAARRSTLPERAHGAGGTP